MHSSLFNDMFMAFKTILKRGIKYKNKLRMPAKNLCVVQQRQKSAILSAIALPKRFSGAAYYVSCTPAKNFYNPNK